MSQAISEFNILFPALKSALNKNSVDWPQRLFIKQGDLFLKPLQSRAEQTRLEVNQLATVDTVGDMELHELRRLDPKTSWHESNWSFYVKRGQDLKLKGKVRIHHRVYSLHELRTLFERAGWRYVKIYGEFDLSPFKLDSKRMIDCCRA